MKDLIIRKAIVDDAKEILDINIQSWKKTYCNIFPKEYLDNLCSDPEEYKHSIIKMENKIKERDYMVAVSDDTVVGFCNYGISKKEKIPNAGEIYALYIKNECLKMGIGRELFFETVKILKSKYNKVIVSCLKENPSNIFYEKMNCKKIGECDFVLNDNVYKENIYEVI